jgi:hypothetical protein
MKKIYLFALSVFALNQAQAQLSLTKANSEPTVGDTYIMGIIDTTNALPNSITGAGATWDVIGISESGLVDTTKYIAASADPNSSTYPGTTIVEKQGTNTTYFKSIATQFELLGISCWVRLYQQRYWFRNYDGLVNRRIYKYYSNYGRWKWNIKYK